MIVDPDFLDHWRTRMLVDMLGDETAPLCVIRLWGHCQNRREWVFVGMPVHATKAICRYAGDAHELETALIECGFLDRNADEITVVGWDEHNSSLIKNWRNGNKGGRPAKKAAEKPKQNPTETQPKPNGNPGETQAEPADNHVLTDKIGLDRIDKSRKEKPSLPSADAEDVRFAEWMLSVITQAQPDFKKPNIKAWANTIRLMRERDGRDHRDMGFVWKWTRQDPFWSANVLSANTFRKQYDRLKAKMQTEGGTHGPHKQASGITLEDQNDTSWIYDEDMQDFLRKHGVASEPDIDGADSDEACLETGVLEQRSIGRG